MNSHAGAGRYTSERNARRMLARGLAVEVGPRAIRLLQDEEIRLARRAQIEQLSDERYWRAVEVERLGGTASEGSLAYDMRIEAPRPITPGGPQGASTVSFIPYKVAHPCPTS